MDLYASFAQAREQVAYFMRRLYRQGLTSCSGGNISFRVSDELVLLTPSTLDKGELQADQVVLMTMDGKNISDWLKPTIEYELHLETLRQRQDMRALVHAHPVYATTLACTGISIDTGMTPETLMTIHPMAEVSCHMAGSRELAEATAAALKTCNVAVMKNHGVAAVGPTLLKAFDRLEVTEISAKMTAIARMLGKSPAMPDAVLQATILSLQ